MKTGSSRIRGQGLLEVLVAVVLLLALGALFIKHRSSQANTPVDPAPQAAANEDPADETTPDAEKKDEQPTRAPQE